VIDIHLKSGEAFPIEFTFVDSEGDLVDVTEGAFTFTIKEDEFATINEVEIVDSDPAWNKVDVADGKVILSLSSANLTLPRGKHNGECKVVLGVNVLKSESIRFWVGTALSA